jgi:hypothetical protein
MDTKASIYYRQLFQSEAADCGGAPGGCQPKKRGDYENEKEKHWKQL